MIGGRFAPLSVRPPPWTFRSWLVVFLVQHDIRTLWHEPAFGFKSGKLWSTNQKGHV